MQAHATRGGVGFTTTRTKVIDLYRKAGQPFEAKTRPYKSTRRFGGVFVHPKDDQGQPTDFAFLKFPVQTVEFFGYGRGDQHPDTQQRALADDTNLASGSRTNGAEDFVIEAVSASARNFAIETGFAGLGQIADPEVIAALTGLLPLRDPGALFSPIEIDSPLTLEHVVFEMLRPHISISFVFDEEKVIEIGTLDQIGEGAGKSYLKTAGEPSTNSRFRIPEGFLWRRDGQPDCSFVCRAHLARALCLPVTLAKNPIHGDTPTLRPGRFGLDVSMRLHGLSVKLPSNN